MHKTVIDKNNRTIHSYDPRIQAIECMLSRHFEGIIDSLLQSIFDFIIPLLSIDLNDFENENENENENNDSNETDSNDSNDSNDENEENEDEMNENVMDLDNEVENQIEEIIFNSENNENNNNKQLKLKSNQIIETIENENNNFQRINSLKHLINEKSINNEKSLNSDLKTKENIKSHSIRLKIQNYPKKIKLLTKITNNNQQFNWQHILLIIQLLMNDKNEENDLIENELPSLQLNNELIERITNRLHGLFGNVKHKELYREIPSFR